MPEGISLLTIFVLSAFTGYEVISKVSTILHTPLMSSANAISGLILVGAVLVAGRADSTVELVVGLLAVALAAVNLVGGFVVTDRMLDMFRGRRAAPAGAGTADGQAAGGQAAGGGKASGRTSRRMSRRAKNAAAASATTANVEPGGQSGNGAS